MTHRTLTAAALAIAAIVPSFARISTPAAHEAFARKIAKAENQSLKHRFDTARLTPEQAEAMEFIYAYLPEADMADRDFDFYLENVDAALKARQEMPWGADVPDREWRHFVLPVRVNNEDLDMSRPVFYEELKSRVGNLPMKDAVLEVNHWCHEKVTYQPSDGRTSSPLSSVSQAIGRCGEESTFAVAALRAVGIPARQVYTPRWAHTDDNHAWVEVWADGRWWFIGACEPEPVLDLAWFNAPASRGMLMNTNVFGQYDGPEEVLMANELGTRINVTANYAPVHQTKVRVRNADGTPAAGAVVKFCIYNYAEYFPVATKKTDAAGETSLTTGLGDIVVWAFGNGRFNVAKADGSHDTTEIVLDKDSNYAGAVEFDIVPPKGGHNTPEVTPAQRALNNRRFATEDSIRNAYTSTFATAASASAFAAETGLDPCEMTLILTESRGNHTAITTFLRGLPPQMRSKAAALLLNVSEKDRRDIPVEVIADHIGFTMPQAAGIDTETYNRYILNPRVENEGLTPYKRPLADELASIDAQIQT
ncbi:MAG: transglutaminase-like domain-containing protein, partial [Muribaculaceae bacterium]|nr:transglutaminase-like domain-containing protein [Muribaculaceae bacterium]